MNSQHQSDRKKVIIGLVLFLAILVAPAVWSWVCVAAGWGSNEKPKLEYTPKAKEAKVCVRETEYMTAEHMQLLDEWRDNVVRKGKRVYVNTVGKQFNMSLTNTCLDCHSNKDKFCDRCHDYASVSPYCWDCHIDNPKEKEE